MDKIRLIIIDDDPDWISAMKLFLKNEAGLEIVATTQCGAQAEEIIKTVPADVILMDIHLADEEHDGIFLAANLLLNHPLKIIMLTSSNEENQILDSFAAGAVNYVNKTNYREIPAAVKAAYGASTPADVLLRDYARLREREMLQMLTPTEKEIIRLLDEGYTHSQIRKMLYKSESTLKNQINTLLKKLEVKNTREALMKIRTKGIIR